MGKLRFRVNYLPKFAQLAGRQYLRLWQMFKLKLLIIVVSFVNVCIAATFVLIPFI